MLQWLLFQWLLVRRLRSCCPLLCLGRLLLRWWWRRLLLLLLRLLLLQQLQQQRLSLLQLRNWLLCCGRGHLLLSLLLRCSLFKLRYWLLQRGRYLVLSFLRCGRLLLSWRLRLCCHGRIPGSSRCLREVAEHWRLSTLLCFSPLPLIC
jgi:hypothetical protein